MPFIRRAGRPGLLEVAARTAVVAGTATAVSGGMQARQQQSAQQQQEAQQLQLQQQAQEAVPAAATPGAADDLMGQLERLAALHGQGILTDAEFTAAKSKLLG